MHIDFLTAHIECMESANTEDLKNELHAGFLEFRRSEGLPEDMDAAELLKVLKANPCYQ